MVQMLGLMVAKYIKAEWQFPNQLYKTVAAMAVRDATKKGDHRKVEFTPSDFERYLLRVCIAVRGIDGYFESEPAIAELIASARGLIGTAQSKNPSLTGKTLEDALLHGGNGQHETTGEVLYSLHMLVANVAHGIFTYMKERDSLPRLVRCMSKNGSNRQGYTYRLAR